MPLIMATQKAIHTYANTNLITHTIRNITITASRYAPRAGIADFITQSPGLSALLGALTQADLINTLSTEGPFTVFAPKNAAFDALSTEQKEAVTNNPDLLSSITESSRC